MRAKKPGESWKCECGARHELGMYVAAHWTERLIHTCDKCGRKHSVERGVIELGEFDGEFRHNIKPKKKKKRA